LAAFTAIFGAGCSAETSAEDLETSESAYKGSWIPAGPGPKTWTVPGRLEKTGIACNVDMTRGLCVSKGCTSTERAVPKMSLTFHEDAAGKVTFEPLPMTICGGGAKNWTPLNLEVNRSFSRNLTPSSSWQCMEGPIVFYGSLTDVQGKPTLEQHCEVQYRDDEERVIGAREDWTFVADDNDLDLRATFANIDGTAPDCWDRQWGADAKAVCDVSGDLNGAATVSCDLEIPYRLFKSVMGEMKCVTRFRQETVSKTVTNFGSGTPVLLGDTAQNRFLYVRKNGPSLEVTNLRWKDTTRDLDFAQESSAEVAPLLPK
jgi:hypothetical protein